MEEKERRLAWAEIGQGTGVEEEGDWVSEVMVGREISVTVRVCARGSVCWYKGG